LARQQQSPPLAAAASPVRAEADEKISQLTEQTANSFGKDADLAREQRGWLPVKVDGRLHLLGWVQPAGADGVRGVELEMTALSSRLGGALPAEISGEEGYALRDDQGRVLHQAGAVPRAAVAAITVPLAADLLPGWDVVAFMPVVAGDSAATGGFFLISMLLVGIFVAAIVAGGSLLLWQARRSEAEAAQKTSFVANVSHEFKTPLTTIRLYSELLEQGRVRDAAQSGEYLRTIGRETQRLARLVGNALDFSRLEQGRKKYARDNLDLRAELARLLDTQAPRLAEAGLVLRRDLPAEPLPVTSDRDALEQIVLNLLDNAAKYGAEGGEVTVALAPRPAHGAVVRVLDRGPGVPPAHRERIFEKFHRVDDTLTAEKAGAGLGLSIARQLARGLGGELRHLPREGGGASFILELP
jgi:signal transduction histidine kinase